MVTRREELLQSKDFLNQMMKNADPNNVKLHKEIFRKLAEIDRELNIR